MEEKIIVGGKEIKIPSLDEIIKEYPPLSDEEIGEIEYEDEDEEEELDTVFPLLEIEKQFYDDEGKRIGDEEEEKRSEVFNS